MHGRKKLDKPRSEEELAAIRAKVLNYSKVVAATNQLRRELLAHPSAQTQKTLLDVVDKVVRVNPDYYSMWNYRKEAALPILEAAEGQAKVGVQERRAQVVEQELALAAAAFKRNPKCYSAWHHRRWVLERGADAIGGEAAYRRELELCRQFLLLDSRNFHCWAYRGWVVEQAGLSAEEDFAFTTEKILENFSNYSAFHYRSKLLPAVAEARGAGGVLTLVEQELEMVHQAFFTEPDDQSAWWYHRFLVGWAAEALHGTEHHDKYPELLQKEVDCIRELLFVEERCKWALVTLHHLLCALARTAQDTEGVELMAEARSLVTTLVDVDPMHKSYYDSLLQ
ncbi:rab geranylgeranyltransferase alpha [Tribonema minus]|uniref:Geranylgeranyl transferase type-2 subunit alpha n=1 Tax=Tribonema minus TaxID=303371 RepID=A0A835Z1Z5_9STRA|nr:rab geranylgeranyltransferase alpha [Tribonema minus]